MMFEEPADVRNIAFVNWSHDEEDRDDDQWIYPPALKRIKRINSGSRTCLGEKRKRVGQKPHPPDFRLAVHLSESAVRLLDPMEINAAVRFGPRAHGPPWPCVQTLD